MTTTSIRHEQARLSFLAVLAVAALGCATNQPLSTQIDDAAITAKIESKLAADPETNPFEIDVDTQDGIVRLSGNVETEAGRREAEKIARETAGVRSVVNDIDIGDPTLGENITDAWILTKIKAKFTADPEINPLNIDIDVVEGVVTLSGKVEDSETRSEAERLARNTKGVKSVRNRIEIEHEG